MLKKNELNFSIHPSVVYQLGESLISDEVMALIELVKNCFDADAKYAKVIIDTEGKINLKESLFSNDRSRIIIEDDGHGMTLEDIKSGWLSISNRRKQELKKSKRTSPGGRTPLGDKGLGRLGVQRLGNKLEIFTKHAEEGCYRLGFSWNNFEKAESISDVKFVIEECNVLKSPGTKVVISDLKEIETWRGERAIKKLENELSQMISPYKAIQDFFVMIEIDGNRIELAEINEKIRDVAPVRYKIDFDGEMLIIKGLAKLNFFKPNNPQNAQEFALSVESDGGKSFFEFLMKNKLSKSINLSLSNNRNWFIEYGSKKRLDDIDQIAFQYFNEKVANPGSFYGEIDSFDLGTSTFGEQNVFDKISEYRKFIKNLSGVGVYRDGFKIRVDKDWLRLGKQWTSAQSYYGLKPDTTLGFIALSAKNNIDLEETTDREGFKDTPHYQNFYLLLDEFIKFTQKAHKLFGRSLVEYRKTKLEDSAQIDSRKSIEDISKTLKMELSEASKHKEPLKNIHIQLQRAVHDSKILVEKISSSKNISPDLLKDLNTKMNSLEPLLENAQKVLNDTSKYLEKIERTQSLGQIINNRVENIRNQLDDMYETVALGLVAEALSHEVFNVANFLAEKSKKAQNRFRKLGIKDQIISSFFEYVNSSIMALRKQMSFLSPSLQYVRERKDIIEIPSFMIDIANFYKATLANRNIEIEIISNIDTEFTIRMNKGKLTQIIDNLIQNCEYWVKEDIRLQKIKSGKITIEIYSPFIRIFDNGRGIDPSIEQAIFEPFISAKKNGRGLGLFIIKQLLDAENCSIGIIPKRNVFNRFFKFQIDLRGAIHA